MCVSQFFDSHHGDRVEGLLKGFERQALYAKTLGFKKPGREETIFQDSELPEDFDQLLKSWEEYSEKGFD